MKIQKTNKKIAKENLDRICYELDLTIKQDKQRRDYIISRDGIYLFRVSLHHKHPYFGVRFGINQSCIYDYDDKKVEELVNRILKERLTRRHSNGTDYSRDKHIV